MATQDVLPTRRAVIAGTAAAAALALPDASADASSGIAPTAYGRALLRMIAAEHRAIAQWNAADASGDDEDPAKLALVERATRIEDSIRAFGREICSRPVTRAGDMIDRAILAAWDCVPYEGKLIATDDESISGFRTSLMLSLLAAAGITPAQVNYHMRDA